jgi:2-oxoglutarate dehydrogenase complex dehydrogenase (E1) component-like enzyme
MSGWQEFTGLNRGYVLELYEKYRQDSSSVDADTRALFDGWTPTTQDTEALGDDVVRVCGVEDLLSQRASGGLLRDLRSTSHAGTA